MTETGTKRKGKQAEFTYVGGKYPGVCSITVKGEQVWYAKYTTPDRVSHFERIGTAAEGWTKGKVKDERAARKRGLSKTNQERKADALAEKAIRATVPNGVTPDTTFAEYAEKWLARKRTKLKFSTVGDYASALNAHVLPAIGKVQLSKISYSTLDDFVCGISGISGKRTNNIMGVVKGIFSDAVKRGELQANPAEKIEREREEPSEVDPLSFAEMNAFMANVDPHYAPYFWTAFLTGMRPSEMFALKWSNVNLEARTIAVREGRVRGMEGPLKTTSSYRNIDILAPLHEILRQHRRASPADATHVFVGKRFGLPLEVGNLRADIWYPTIVAAGLRRRTMYQTRHTFASLMISYGEDLMWIASMLGHSTLAMIFRHYGKLIKNREERRDGRKFLAAFDAAGVSTKALPATVDTTCDVVATNGAAS